MFSNSQFEPNSAYSGGGFMSSQPSQAYEPSSSSTAKNLEFQGLVPVTVKQISEASQSDGEKSGLVINEPTKVSLVGLVCDKDVSKVTEVRFILDDGTGRLDCIRWVNESFDTREMESVRDGIYVRLNGHLKTFQGKKQLLVFSVRPIMDFNEVIHFYSNNSESQVVSSHNNDGNRRKNLDDMVLDYLKLPACTARQQGIHLDEITQQLKVPNKKLEDVIQSLEADALIYSTIDDYHFKLLEL